MRVYTEDLLFLQEERLRVRRERFRRDRELAQPSLADVLSELLDELEHLRARDRDEYRRN